MYWAPATFTRLETAQRDKQTTKGQLSYDEVKSSEQHTMSLESTLKLIFMASLVIAVVGWLFPMKLKLLKKHGFDKTNVYFIDLARQGDPDALKLYRGSKIVLIVAISCVLSYTTYQLFV